MMMAVQQYRVFRLAMLLIIVAFTIFLYASYYANTSISTGIPSTIRMQHTASSLIGGGGGSSGGGGGGAGSIDDIGGGGDDERLVLLNNNELNAGGGGGGGGGGGDGGNLQNNNRNRYYIQTAADDINGSYAQQYVDISSLPAIPASSQQSNRQFKNNNSNNNNNSSAVMGGGNSKGDKNQSIITSVDPSNGSSGGVGGSGSSSVSSLAPSINPDLIQSSLSVGVSSPVKQQQSSQPQEQSAPAAQPAVVTSVVQSQSSIVTAEKLLKGVRTSDLYVFGYTEPNIEICPEQGEFLRLLILITSAPSHQDARLSIRQTWAHYGQRRDIAVAFMLGYSGHQSIEDSLDAEHFMYGDLIRGKFYDSYNNLTLKTVSLMEWVDTYCSRVTFVLKTDDDMFINVPRLLLFMEKHQKEKNVIFGRLAKKWKPIRNKKSKYYVSPQQYFPPVFPPFTTGPAYLMTADVVHGLYRKALNQTYLKLEDVFMTGIVAQLVNVKRIHVNEFLNRRIAFNPCNIRKSISVHMIKTNEQFDLWKKLLDTNTKCK